jgi:hypothetical protein
MTIQCPCCGQSVAGDLPIAALEHVSLSPMQRQIVGLLLEKYPQPVSTGRIASRIYGGSPDGGPLTASNVIHVQLARIRHALKPMGWTAGSMARKRDTITLRRTGAVQ